MFQPCAEFIEAALRVPGNRVFVHCKVGTSRSVSIVLFYMISKRGYSLRDALRHIMGQRALNPNGAPYTHPNAGFIRKLIDEERKFRGDATMTEEEYFSKYSTGKNIPHEHAA